MQYLLNAEEMFELREKEMAVAKLTNGKRIDDFVVALTNVCQSVATTMIPTATLNGFAVKDHPHGCIHVKMADQRRNIHYCDGCQVAGICPQPKAWSK